MKTKSSGKLLSHSSLENDYGIKSKIFAALPSIVAFKKTFECIGPDYANRIESIQTAPEASVM